MCSDFLNCESKLPCFCHTLPSLGFLFSNRTHTRIFCCICSHQCLPVFFITHWSSLNSSLFSFLLVSTQSMGFHCKLSFHVGRCFVCLYICESHAFSVLGVKKRMTDPLKLELQIVVNCMWVLGI